MDIGQLLLIGVFALVLLIFILLILTVNANPKAYPIWSKQKPDTMGTLHIYTGDPDGAYMFLELSSTVEELISRKTVTLDVDIRHHDISQK